MQGRAVQLTSPGVAVFKAIERRFSWHARAAFLIVGLSGFYMVSRSDLWDRFHSAAYWWMHAMVAVWGLFALLLFVVEPLIAHRWFDMEASRQPDAALRRLQPSHWLLLGLALLTIFGAVAGSHGWLVF